MNNRILAETLGRSTYMAGVNMCAEFVWKYYKETGDNIEVLKVWGKMHRELMTWEGPDAVWNKEAAEAASKAYDRIFGAAEEYDKRFGER